MKTNTYITTIEDSNGHTINFERWNYKRPNTCIRKMAVLYSGVYGAKELYDQDLNRATTVACYPTVDGFTRSDPVWSASVSDFRVIVDREANSAHCTNPLL